MRHHTHTTSGTKVFHLPAHTCLNSGRQPHKLPRQHIIGESLDWTCLEADRALVRQMWEQGKPGMEIAEAVGLHWLVLTVLVWEEIEEGLIQERPGGFHSTA